MKQEKAISDNGRLTGVEAALRRAAIRAREIAAQTGTPLIIYGDGEIKKIMISPKRARKPSSR
jgi:hypothetical protein